jgi:cytochrome b-561
VFVMVASIAGMNNILADVLGTSTGVVNPALLVAILVAPSVAGVVTYGMLRGNEPNSQDAEVAADD